MDFQGIYHGVVVTSFPATLEDIGRGIVREPAERISL